MVVKEKMYTVKQACENTWHLFEGYSEVEWWKIEWVDSSYCLHIWMRGAGVPLSRSETNDLLSDEPEELRLMGTKSVVKANLKGRTFTHIPPQKTHDGQTP
ncbi:MAG: hypothetical protein ACTSVF_04670 [Candidatus Asgardarchaeia archaeon]